MPDKRTVSPERRAANRAAAQKSTGPKTPEGKQRAAFNSFQHGAFASQDHIMQKALARSGYDPAAFDAARQSLLDDWQPTGTQQKLLVDDLVWLYWLRDQSRLALLESQALQLPAAQLHRDQRRFEARHRDPAVYNSDSYPEGYLSAPACPDKFTVIAALLDDLKDCLLQGNWSERAHNGRGFRAQTILRDIYSPPPATARGRKLSDLWYDCSHDKPSPDDPRMQQMFAWIAEERAALLEEEQLFHRQEALEKEQDELSDSSALRPLDETWQEIVQRLQQLDRQINAKIRLLLRLQRPAPAARSAPHPVTDPATPSAIPDDPPENATRPGPDPGAAADGDRATSDPAAESARRGAACRTLPPTSVPNRLEQVVVQNIEIHGTKPSDPLESTIRLVAPPPHTVAVAQRSAIQQVARTCAVQVRGF